MTRSRLFVGALAIAALVAATEGAPSVGATHPASGRASAAHAAAGHTATKGKVGGWTQLSSRGVTIIKIPDVLALSSGGIQVVWAQEDGPSKQSLRTRIVKESGRIGSPIETVVQNWPDIVDDPQIINHGGDRLI